MNPLTSIITPISTQITPTNGTTWQSAQTNAGADQYVAKFDMSVSINAIVTQVLVGVQLINSVYLFSYNATSLTLITSINNGRGTGFGKDVT